MSYIYKITNLVNNKLYIGKTSLSSIQLRFKEHAYDSKRRGKEKRPLYEAMNKYGIENFKISLIEEVPNDKIASQREQFWINKLRTYIGFDDCNGYNATLGGDSKHYYDYKVLAEKYVELKSQEKVAAFFHCDPETVRKACQEYKDLTNDIYIQNKNRNRKQIKRIHPKTKEEKIYNSITEASFDFPNKDSETARKNISRALNKRTLGYGYFWQFL